jgi:DNA-binding MarR family transcriptional regulator
MASDGTLSRLELDAWRGLLRTHTRLERELDQELTATEGIGLSCYEVMLRLAQAPQYRLRMKVIADSLLRSRSGLTGIVNELERRGYVTRERASGDGRGIEASLTRSGHAAFRRVQRRHLNGVREKFLERLSERQLSQLTEIWQAVGTGTEPDLPTDADR